MKLKAVAVTLANKVHSLDLSIDSGKVDGFSRDTAEDCGALSPHCQHSFNNVRLAIFYD